MCKSPVGRKNGVNAFIKIADMTYSDFNSVYQKVKQNFTISFYYRGSFDVKFDLRWSCATADTDDWDCSGCACVYTGSITPGYLPVDYAGTISTTERGKTCLPWQEVSQPDRDNEEIFRPLECDHNYCRNPSGRWSFPDAAWCYVNNNDVIAVEYCKYSGNSWAKVLFENIMIFSSMLF